MVKVYGRRTIIILLVALLIYVFVCCILLPMRHKKISGEYLDALKSLDTEELAEDTGRISCIDDNEEALLWRLRLIEAAKERIILTTFDMTDDNGGSDIMAALLNAADRGVEVRILVDGINGVLHLNDCDSFQALTAAPSVEAKLYNKINFFRLWNANYRMHDKYLIADDFVYILGGRNTNDLFLGHYQEFYNIDRDILVYEGEHGKEGSLARLEAYFQEIWNLPCCTDFTYGGSSKKVAAAAQELRDRYGRLKERYPDAFQGTDWEKETMCEAGVRLLTGSTAAAKKAPEMWYSVYEVMSRGEDILIETPYIVCSREMYRGLSALCDDGKAIRIITNAVESGANPWGCTDYLNQKKKILGTGVSVYETLAGQSLHTKTFLIDDRFSIVGSYNLDIRSTYLDTELMLLIDSPELNALLRERAEAYKEAARLSMPDGTQQLGSAYQEVEFTLGKRIFYGMLRTLILPFRYLL